MSSKENSKDVITFGLNTLSIELINSIAAGARTKLSSDAIFTKKINAGVSFLEEVLKDDGVIYGVTTGYGDNCTQAVALSLVDTLPINLTRFHGCGLGDYFTPAQARAIMAVRLCSLAKGVSGVRLELMDKIISLLNLGITPQIPEEGSVGASGDLTPLSYLAAVLIGEREVVYQGELQTTEDVFKQTKITPLTLRPKEGLALMNGTAVMTALACEAYQRASYLSQLAARLTAMATIALKGNAFHFDEQLFAVKPHPGQQRIAAWIRSDLEHESMLRNSSRLQNRYSIRCAPHVIGALEDTLPWCRQMIENELNSANDNPIIDGENKHILHGGHFYGGHIAAVMDTLKTLIANLADLIDRQLALLVDPKFNNGLPANLSNPQNQCPSVNHGMKAVQIGASAWTAEALKQTMPASVFSRSTECHNQDKVSMGTIAARDCLRVLTLTEQVFSAHTLAVTQAIHIRLSKKELSEKQLSASISLMLKEVLESFTVIDEDRRLDLDLRHFVTLIEKRQWKLYA